MKRTLILAYGLLCYLVFLGLFGCMIGFTGNFVVPRSIDTGPATAAWLAVIVDLGLIALFGLQHSVMARAWFKRWWRQFIPEAAERSTYVLAASLLLGLLMWQWRPLRVTVWQVEHPGGRFALWGIFWLGWGITLVSTFLIDHFDLFGLRQVISYWRGQTYSPPDFQSPALYRYVRHPLMLGLTLAFWATPHMTVGHLLFALGMTAYILVGIRLEERDLLRQLGDRYRAYRQRTSMLLPLPMSEQDDRLRGDKHEQAPESFKTNS